MWLFFSLKYGKYMFNEREIQEHMLLLILLLTHIQIHICFPCNLIRILSINDRRHSNIILKRKIPVSLIHLGVLSTIIFYHLNYFGAFAMLPYVQCSLNVMHGTTQSPLQRQLSSEWLNGAFGRLIMQFDWYRIYIYVFLYNWELECLGIWKKILIQVFKIIV